MGSSLSTDSAARCPSASSDGALCPLYNGGMLASLLLFCTARRWRQALLSLAFVVVGLAWTSTARAASVVIDDFEDVSDWSGLSAETSEVRQGSGAGRWADVVAQTSVRKEFGSPQDLSSYSHFGFWLYSTVANGQTLQLVFDSDDPNSDGWDYYTTALTVDWTGWRWLWLSKLELGAARNPIGWHEIYAVSLSADGWSHTPLGDTNLVLDTMVMADAVVTGITREQGWAGADFVYTWTLELTEPDGTALGVDIACDVPTGLTAAIDRPHVDLPPAGVESVVVDVTIPASVIAQGAYQTHGVTFTILHGSGGQEGWFELVANPPAAQSPPRMLLTADDFTRIDSWAVTHSWAESRRQRIIDRADGWPADFLTEYGLGSVALPPEGGQWGMHYVCPNHGVNLVFDPPMTHRCPIDDELFAGWPYDQVIYARQHNDLARAARDAGLAYQLTGQQSYADSAAQLLRDYAAVYNTYAIHSPAGGESSSGARVLSQTLDESGWLVQMAWAYDLIAQSGSLAPAERTQVEQDLLRSCAAIIQRHDAGLSNWQAWHNAAIAAAGRAVGDPRLVAHAVSGPSGFHRHMADSVLSDGFWYESSWGYHFFTLSPMTYLAEMGERGGFPLYPDPALQSMYLAPILFAPPDLVLPAFNDSGTVNLRGSAGWRLDAAYRAYADDRLVLPLLGESRDEEALFWGTETLPTQAPTVTESLIFDASGYAVMRGGTEADPWYLALDYGPHGGWHGHFDKLGYVFFARGKMLGIDPGSHSYALPLHDSWDRSTIAHNTVTVDEIDQAEATGSLERFLAFPGLVWARASAGPVYENATLARDMVMADGYLLDRVDARSSDGQSHQFDWLYHNPGVLTHELSASSYDGFPDDGGYQHLDNSQAETTDRDGRFVFSFQTDATYAGGFWASEAGVIAASNYSDAEVHGGEWSNQLHYDFSAAPGAYITFRTRSLSEYTEEAPTHLSVWVRGDSSNNSYRLRIVDATGESHVTEATTLDFSDWRQASYPVDSSLSHWGGNDDGVIDLPLDNLVFQLNHETGGTTAGDVYLDDWQLTFPTAGDVTVEDFERLVAQELVWLSGQPDTTFVVGDGIGPDLTVPVPYVMVRRNGTSVSFDALHEPHGRAGPLVTEFSVVGSDAPEVDRAVGYRVAGTSESTSEPYGDVVMLVGAASGGTLRTFGQHATDGTLGYVRVRGDGTMARLALADGALVADSVRELYTAPQPLVHVMFAIVPGTVEILAIDGELLDSRLLAPNTSQVSYQGVPVPFVQDGDYVLFGSLDGTPPGGGGAGEEDSGCDCAVPHRHSTTPPWWLSLLALCGLARRRAR